VGISLIVEQIDPVDVWSDADGMSVERKLRAMAYNAQWYDWSFVARGETRRWFYYPRVAHHHHACL
jgi:hypothetical protein